MTIIFRYNKSKLDLDQNEDGITKNTSRKDLRQIAEQEDHKKSKKKINHRYLIKFLSITIFSNFKRKTKSNHRNTPKHVRGGNHQR